MSTLAKKSSQAPLKSPRGKNTPEDWHEKIEIAKQARKVGQEIRKGKRLDFTTRRSPWS